MTKVTSKGQVTIPQAIRRALDIVTGDRVVFELHENGAHLRVVKSGRLGDLYGALPATRSFPGTAAVREEVGRALGFRGAGDPEKGQSLGVGREAVTPAELVSRYLTYSLLYALMS